MSVAQAFDRGAARYDLMVALNPGYHRELRRAAAALVERTEICRRRGSPSVIDLPSIDIPSNDLSFIDLACGSGASTRALVDAAPPAPPSSVSMPHRACWLRRPPRTGRRRFGSIVQWPGLWTWT